MLYVLAQKQVAHLFISWHRNSLNRLSLLTTEKFGGGYFQIYTFVIHLHQKKEPEQVDSRYL